MLKAGFSKRCLLAEWELLSVWCPAVGHHFRSLPGLDFSKPDLAPGAVLFRAEFNAADCHFPELAVIDHRLRDRYPKALFPWCHGVRLQGKLT